MKTGIIKTYQASSVEDIYEAMSDIRSEGSESGGSGKLNHRNLWFHGTRRNTYDLLPSSFLEISDSDVEPEEAEYGIERAQRRKQLEELKYMNFSAKSKHRMDDKPETMSGWMELMQHYGGHTRMLDWSESMRISLGIALKYYLTPDRKDAMLLKREMATPVLWVLDPARLNNHIYDLFLNNPIYVKDAVSEFYARQQTSEIDDMAKKIVEDMKDRSRFFPREFPYQPGGEELFSEMKGIVCLSAISSLRQNHPDLIQKHLQDSTFNPFYYLLLRYYEDSLPIELADESMILPPLASLQPYNNENIRARRSAFTVFPNYYLDKGMYEKKHIMGMDMMAMNHQNICRDCLYRIQLLRPGYIAKELMTAGDRISDLYPDLNHVVDTLEARKYFN